MEVAFLSREEFPSYREDVATLIESELSSHCDIKFFARSKVTDEKSIEKNNDYKFTKDYGKGSLARKLNKISQLVLLIKFCNYMVKHRASIAIVRDDPFSAMVVILLSKLFGFEFCYWVSFLNGEMLRDDAMRRKSRIRMMLAYWTLSLETFVFRQASNAIFQSEPMQEYFESRYSRKFKSIAIPMGADFINAERFKSNKRVPYSISYIGSMDLSRNIDFVIDTFALVKEEIPTSKLFLIGGSVRKDSEERVKEYIDQKGLTSSIILTGHIDREKAWELLSSSSISISYVPRNSFFDVSSPTKFVESIALGVPVVASDIPDQKLFSEQIGLEKFICRNDKEEFSNKILEIVNRNEVLEESTIKKAKETRDYRFLGIRLYNFLNEI
ncbi:glycosyl transferase group 1 [Vibrio sinaloensis DSM 21326]|uniref:Glycosyl transferase group 1 n=1 Tax=Vibrio sinaloensis DSM 21326 TaxID=945550 RepID=E8MAW1_PHOS4|nr:glycosyltransferase [Vibrio sinaloensis]EGA68791.1 glycosyl transferase group 1 [Vibrio sinaloensis DSM 21326]